MINRKIEKKFTNALAAIGKLVHAIEKAKYAITVYRGWTLAAYEISYWIGEDLLSVKVVGVLSVNLCRKILQFIKNLLIN